MSDESANTPSDQSRARIRSELLRLLNNNGFECKEHMQGFRYALEGEYGRITIYFEVGSALLDWALRTSLTLTRRNFDEAVKTLEDQGKIRRAPDLIVEEEITETDEADYKIAAFLAFLVIAGSGNKFASAIHELRLETEQIFDGFLREQIKQTDVIKEAGYEPPSIANAIRALSKSFANERRQFLTAQIERLSDKPRFERLPELYPTLLKVWQSAKRIYSDYGESETWRDMVKVKYPELTFDDDLLTRVTGKLEDLPEDVQTKLAEKDGDHTPNTIALEHAARMCGATPYQYGVRHYHNLKTEQKETE
jgi:hypothetical protein